jgi:hypothetical protein
MTFSDWSEDVHLLAKWLKDQSPEVPLVLHGLGVGALLASRAFHGGAGEVLLLWSPPESANQAVRSAVVRWINVEQLFKYGDERKPASAFIQELELGSSVEVEGYQFTGKLWQNSFLFDMPPGYSLKTGNGSQPAFTTRGRSSERRYPRARVVLIGGTWQYDSRYLPLATGRIFRCAWDSRRLQGHRDFIDQWLARAQSWNR